MTITQEHHQFKRYGAHNYNNHETSVGGGTPLFKHQDFINDKPNVVPMRMSNTQKIILMRKIKQRQAENVGLVVDNPFN